VALFDRILNLLAFLAAALIAFMMLSVCFEVIMRYFFNRPTSWVLETAEILLLYIAFLPAAWLLREEGHVRMDLVLVRLKPRHQAWVNMITSILAALVFSVIIWYGTQVTWDHFQTGEFEPTLLKIPNAYFSVVIPVCSFFFFIQLLRRIRSYMRSWRT